MSWPTVPVADDVSVRGGDGVGDGESVSCDDAERPAESVRDMPLVADADADPVGDVDGVDDGVIVCDSGNDSVSDAVDGRVADADPLGDVDGVDDGITVCESVDNSVSDAVDCCVADALATAVRVGVPKFVVNTCTSAEVGVALHRTVPLACSASTVPPLMWVA
jgi:hypothetical protein